MVYKKYIKKGGKVYGPYLYHNHREWDKVITSYIGKHEEHKGNKNKIWMLVPIVILLLFAIGIILFYQDFTGKATELNGDVVERNVIGTVQENKEGVVTEKPITEDNITISPSKNIEYRVKYNTPSVIVEIPKVSELGEQPIIILSKPKQSETTVIGELVQWSLRFEVPPGSKVDEIIFTLLSASYVSVEGAKEVFVKTIYLGKENIFDITRPSGVIEVNIKNPESGIVYFFTSGVHIFDIKTTSRGKEIVVINPTDIFYQDVSVIASLEGLDVRAKDIADLRIISDKGDRIDSLSYDIDGDDVLDLVKFDVDMPPGAKKSYEIITFEVKRAEAKKISEGQFIIPVVEFEDVPKECFYSCGSYSSCNYYTRSSDYFKKGVLLLGRQEALCVSDNFNCPPVIKQVRECSFGKKIIVTEDGLESEIYFGPPEVREEEGKVEKEVSIYDKKTDNKVVSIIVKTTEGVATPKVDIVFTQQYSCVYLSPPSCYNGIENKDEEGVDCGGVCRECVEEVESFASRIFNKIFRFDLILLERSFLLDDKSASYKIWNYCSHD